MAHDKFHNGDPQAPTMEQLNQASAVVDLLLKARWEQLAKESMGRLLTMEEMRELLQIMQHGGN